MNERKEAIIAAAVLSLIPPAVLPDAPPTNIIKVIKNNVAVRRFENGIVENPAVRSVTA